MFDFVQDIGACIRGMEFYIQSHSTVVSEGAIIVKKWLEYIWFRA